MSYTLTFDHHSDYLHARVTGTNSRENVVAYMREIRDECERSDCRRVLVEENLDGPRLDFVDIFTMVVTGVREFLGVFHKLAYVDVNQMGDMGDIAETVGVNRGIPVAVFNSVDAARDWLLQS